MSPLASLVAATTLTLAPSTNFNFTPPRKAERASIANLARGACRPELDPKFVR